jgi:nondiscriminating glutamyl-tRNA synthetase
MPALTGRLFTTQEPITMPETRTRFAPSPTGYMHVGNLHTALFEWLFARHSGGTFVLRIEDTDEVRFTPEAVQVIYDGLRWLGIDWDEGPDVGGPYGPYVQSERLETYQAVVRRLLDEGKAYECFCSPAELEQRREIMRAAGEAPRYDGRCAELDAEARRALKEQGLPACVRFRVKTTGTTTIHDLIQGDVTYENAGIADGVIQKASGFPTYHMAVVIDDEAMRITHVIRAVEHLANTHLHLQLQEALGYTSPIYAHLPLILGEDRTKLSKRHGAVSVVDYAEMGYLPEAMLNFLALLGWAPGGEQEVLTRAEVIERFTLKACSNSPAVFDLAKAEWLNGEYVKALSPEQLAEQTLPFVVKAGLFEPEPTPERRAWLARVCGLMQERVRLLATFTTWARYFFTDDYEYEERARKQWLSKAETPDKLEALAGRLEGLGTWGADAIEEAVRGLAAELGVGAGQIIHPCRSAVTGTTVGPSLFHLMEVLEQGDVVARLRRTASLAREGALQPLE